MSECVTRRAWVWVGLLFLLALLPGGGCVTRPREARGPAADAIEAASTVTLSGERLQLLRRIAHRDDLTEPEQLYLVDTICFGGFGGEQADALITLIENPLCTSATRQSIAKRLRFVSSSRDRKRVVEALIKHSDDDGPQEP